MDPPESLEVGAKLPSEATLEGGGPMVTQEPQGIAQFHLHTMTD
jgi:hypothetical protein